MQYALIMCLRNFLWQQNTTCQILGYLTGDQVTLGRGNRCVLV